MIYGEICAFVSCEDKDIRGIMREMYTGKCTLKTVFPQKTFVLSARLRLSLLSGGDFLGSYAHHVFDCPAAGVFSGIY